MTDTGSGDMWQHPAEASVEVTPLIVPLTNSVTITQSSNRPTNGVTSSLSDSVSQGHLHLKGWPAVVQPIQHTVQAHIQYIQ